MHELPEHPFGLNMIPPIQQASSTLSLNTFLRLPTTPFRYSALAEPSTLTSISRHIFFAVSLAKNLAKLIVLMLSSLLTHGALPLTIFPHDKIALSICADKIASTLNAAFASFVRNILPITPLIQLIKPILKSLLNIANATTYA